MYEKNHIIPVDNARIHQLNVLHQIVEDRDIQILYLPTYSPTFLSFIELTWSKLKADIQRDLLTKDNILTPLIIESVKEVSPKNCQHYISRSRFVFQGT